MSLTKPAAGRHQVALCDCRENDDSVTAVTMSNSSRDMATLLPFHESRYKDGGAHWYRSSAVLLHYHRFISPV